MKFLMPNDARRVHGVRFPRPNDARRMHGVKFLRPNDARRMHGVKSVVPNYGTIVRTRLHKLVLATPPQKMTFGPGAVDLTAS